MTKRVAAILLALAVLGGCGKRGSPDPPGPQTDVTYPKTYPTY